MGALGNWMLGWLKNAGDGSKKECMGGGWLGELYGNVDSSKTTCLERIVLPVEMSRQR